MQDNLHWMPTMTDLTEGEGPGGPSGVASTQHRRRHDRGLANTPKSVKVNRRPCAQDGEPCGQENSHLMPSMFQSDGRVMTQVWPGRRRRERGGAALVPSNRRDWAGATGGCQHTPLACAK